MESVFGTGMCSQEEKRREKVKLWNVLVVVIDDSSTLILYDSEQVTMTDAEKPNKEIKQKSDESNSSSSESQGKEKLDQKATQGCTPKFNIILFFSWAPLCIVDKENPKDRKASEAKESDQKPKNDKKIKKKSRGKSNASFPV